MFLREDSGKKKSRGVLDAFEDVFNPMAARMRRELDMQNEQAIPVPSPGDRTLESNKIVISLPDDKVS